MSQNNSFYKTANKAAAAIGTGLILTSLTTQFLVGTRYLNYNFIAGHCGDYGAALAMTSWWNRNKDPHNTKSQLFEALYVTGAWTTFEFLQKAGLWIGTYDPKDIAAFCAGSLTAFAVARFSASKLSPLEEKIS